ncbi:MAG: cation-translocating P-type ATPase [Chloroflexota bacterium]
MNDWYKQTAGQAIEQLGSDAEHGLPAAEAGRRLEQYGSNELIERGVKSPWKILFEQFSETMVVVLIVAALISMFLREFKDAGVILAIVVLNALLGFRQEYQAEQAMAALKKLAVPTVRVRRGGHVQEISARGLVPGDVILLEAGNLVPADCRLLESANLSTQESALTGESEPVAKLVEFPQGEAADLPLAERRNMVYMGTVVTYGRGEALVVETGMQTQLGGIADLMQSAGQEPTPLQRRLDQLGKGLALAALALVAIVFALGLARGEDLKVLVLTSIGMSVAAIPEGLPAVVTIALALGARRMLKRNALIRKLPAVEALGSVTVICSDKTGTLTENRMTVTVLDLADNRFDLMEEEVKLPLHGRNVLCGPPEPTLEQQQALRDMPALSLLLAGGALCNDALLECDDEVSGHFHIVGDPTEGALLLSAARMGLLREALEEIFPRQAEAPFDSERKRMTTVHRMPAAEQDVPQAFRGVWDWGGWAGVEAFSHVAFTKGAIDGLLEITDRVWVQDHIEPMSAAWRARVEAANENLAKQGMRVLGVACRGWQALPEQVGVAQSAEQAAAQFESELILVGIVGMIDPARPEVKNAVQTCRTAGIRPMMITGDHPLTAGYIARELGLITGSAAPRLEELPDMAPEEDRVMTGQELEGLSPEELEDVVRRISVYARVSPEHKLKIVQALQNQGQIAAMTGDGVNDAPALKKADIGVAMGIAGTDVSKEASDIVLLDDNFATIVAAVREGRIIYDNIRRFIQYTLTSNAGEIWVMLLAPFLGMPLPLVPIQILWINLVTDGLPGLALSVEIGEREVMRRKPYPPNENIFARGLGSSVLWIGLLMGLISLGAGYAYWRMGSPLWQTMVFTTLTLSEMGYVMAIRSNRDSLFAIGPFTNRALVGAVGLTTLLQLAVVYVPFLNDLFHTLPLPLGDLLVALALSTTLFWAVELQKWLRRRSK